MAAPSTQKKYTLPFFTLPSAKSSPPRLPSASGSSGANLSRPKSNDPLALGEAKRRAADVGRHVLGVGKRTAHTAALTVARAQSSFEALQQRDTMGGLLARSASSMVATGVMGMIDATDTAKRFFAWTGKVWSLKLSSALAIGAAVLRWTGLDKRIPRQGRKVITSYLLGYANIWSYDRGGDLFGAVKSRIGSGSASSPPQLSGVGPSQPATPSPAAPFVPGESPIPATAI